MDAAQAFQTVRDHYPHCFIVASTDNPNHLGEYKYLIQGHEVIVQQDGTVLEDEEYEQQKS